MRRSHLPLILAIFMMLLPLRDGAPAEAQGEPAAILEGTVRGPDGQPVEGAKVEVVQGRDDIMGLASALVGYKKPWSKRTSTDSEGRFRLDGIPPGTVWIAAEQDGQRQVSRKLDVETGTTEVHLEILAGVELSGRVTAPDGDPIAGASLSLKRDEPSFRTLALFRSSHETRLTSAPDGTFAFPDVPPGSYQLKVSREGFATVEESIEVGDDAVLGLEIGLGQGTLLRGRILGLTNADLAELSFGVYGPRGGREPRVGPDGRYTAANLGPGIWKVVARVPARDREVSRRLEIEADVAEVELDLEFPAGFTLTGVAERDGGPLAGARVSASGSDGGGAVTDSAGRFRIEDLPAGTYKILVTMPKAQQQKLARSLHVADLELAADKDIRLEIVASRISGTVRDRLDQKPITGANLTLQPDAVKGLSLPELFPVGAESDAEGRFLLTEVEDGSWRLIVTKPGYGPAEVDLEVRGGLPIEGLEVEMTPTAGVSFAVFLEDGRVVQMVNLAVLDSEGRRVHADMGKETEEGRAHVSVAQAGSWILIQGVHMDQGGVLTPSAVTRVAVAETGDLGRIELPRGGDLFLRIPEIEDDAGMGWVTLTASDGTPHWGILSLGPQAELSPMMSGKAYVSGVPPGVWSFTASHPDGRTWTGSATVTAGERTEVTVP